MSDGDELRRIRVAIEAIEKSGGVQYSGAGATHELRQTIQSFNEVATRQTDKLIRLTWWIVVLTVVLVIGLVVQIWLALVANAR